MTGRGPLPAALALLALAALAPAAVAQEQPERGITTNGLAAITARQDIARFSFAASARRRTPAAAQAAASLRMTRVISAVRGAGVAPADVRTTSIRLFRQVRRLPGGKRRIVGYRARQSIRVTVRDLARTGPVVDAAVRAGAISVSGPDFDVSNRGALYRDALRVAFRDARDKAQALADEAGVTLGRAIVVVENTRGEPAFGQAQDQEAAAPGSGTEEERVPTPVRPGQEVIEASVTVTFETS